MADTLVVDDLVVGPNMVRNWLQELKDKDAKIEELEDEIAGLNTEVSIAKSDGKIYAGVSKINQLKQVLKDVRPFDTAVKDQYCWCSAENSKCVTSTCIEARVALGLEP